jgi:hypothetical protein
METLLVTVTALSLAIATGLGVLLARLLRQEQRRSDARAALLSEMAAEAPQPIAPASVPQPALRNATPLVATAPRQVRIDDLELRPADATVAGVADLFAAPESASPSGRRLAIAAALAVPIFGLGFLLLSSQPRPVASIAKAVSTQPAAGPTPLELLSLRYTQQDSSLTITGLVQNPRDSAPLSRVVATVFLFGPDGGFLSSGRAPLDFLTLAPGDESPFVVTVPVSGQVARYRVGFRTEGGAVISHVDKRGPDAVASRAGS